MLLLAALFVGIAAMERFDKGQTQPAWALVAICIALIVGSVVQSVAGKDDW